VKVRPKLAAPISSMPLSDEQRFVLARIDGNLSVGDLVALTGIEEKRVQKIVKELAFRGAIDLEGAPSSGYLPDPGSLPALDEGETSLADFAAALGMDPSAFAASEAASKGPAVEAPVPASARARAAAERARAEDEAEEPPILTEADEVHDDDQLAAAEDGEAGAEGEGAAEGAGGAEASAEREEEAADRLTRERNYREIYATKFQPLTTDARVAAAKTSSGSELSALCFDPEPRVVAAILENHTVTLDNVRLIALHHRTGTGLEILSRRQDFLRDVLVERRLLRNPMAGDMVITRIMSGKRLQTIYKIAIDREIPELTRVKSRGHLRKSWQTSPPEDRSDLLIRTEARCLVLLTGCTFDSKTTQILCGRNYASAMFVQNIAKFAASPPGLLAHLYKQPFVRKSPPLRKMLLQHPNMPGEVKRNA
jgi:hypothetical protein